MSDAESLVKVTVQTTFAIWQPFRSVLRKWCSENIH